MMIALIFTGLCLGAGVALAPRVLKVLGRALAGSTPPPGPAAPRTGSQPTPHTGPGRHPAPRDPYAEWETAPPPPTLPDGVPERLPVRIKQSFLARSESAFLSALEASLPSGYRVFPNVRLNDLFFITAREYGEKKGTYARLRDKHVDFLVVALPEHRPVFAIELDGASHDNARQQYRDAVKDTAFRSAGLPLVRLRAELVHTPDSLREVLSQTLSVGAAHA